MSISSGPFSFHAARVEELIQIMRTHLLPGATFDLGNLLMLPISETPEEELAQAIEWHREKGPENRIADGYLAVLAVASHQLGLFDGPEHINGGVLRDADLTPSLIISFFIPHEGVFDSAERHGVDVFTATHGEDGIRSVLEWVVAEANNVWQQHLPTSITALAR